MSHPNAESLTRRKALAEAVEQSLTGIEHAPLAEQYEALAEAQRTLVDLLDGRPITQLSIPGVPGES